MDTVEYIKGSPVPSSKAALHQRAVPRLLKQIQPDSIDARVQVPFSQSQNITILFSRLFPSHNSECAPYHLSWLVP